MELLYKIFIDPFVQMGTAPDLLIQTLWEGLVGGVLYALIALGFVLIFKASGVFNFAQGIMVVFAALTLVGLTNSGVPRGLSILLILAGAGLAGWWLYRRFRPRSAHAAGAPTTSAGAGSSASAWPCSASPRSFCSSAGCRRSLRLPSPSA
jgi:hypothetical protein